MKHINIHDAISYWHSNDIDTPLHMYLGMSWDEYGRWFEGRMTVEHLHALGYYEDR